MRLSADGLRGRIVRVAAVPLMLALAACGGSGPYEGLQIAPAQTGGPRADYPMVVGEPYSVAGTTYTPEDVMNYDEVGYAVADPAGGNAVSGSHHTLPLPSYVEVTSLETGRTILVRLERRGPMDGTELIALSNGALAQLGAAPGAPVRVRRVNPPEDQRALLRAGAPAAPRMDTPMQLVEVLRRKLPNDAAAPQASADAPAQTVAAPEPRIVGGTPLPPVEPRGSDLSTPPIPAAAPRIDGAFVVQAAAFSTSERAERAASALGGQVSRSGAYWRVRTGPFATRGEAEASLAKVRAAGYSDARILTSG